MRKKHVILLVAALLIAPVSSLMAEEQDIDLKIAGSIERLTARDVTYTGGKRAAIDLLVANSAASASQIIRRLESETNFDAKLWLLICINSFSEMSVFDPAAKRLAALLDDEHFAIQFWGIKIAGRMRNNDAVSSLSKFLESENSILRREAARALGMIGQMGPVETIAGLLQDAEKSVRAAAAEALGNLKAERNKAQLIEALSDESVLVIRTTITALERITGKSFKIEEVDWMDPNTWSQKIQHWVEQNN